MGLRLRIATFLMRTIEKPHLARVKDPVLARRKFARTARLTFCKPPNALYLHSTDGPVPMLWASCAKPKSRGVILYFHGGGYVMGSPRTHARMLVRLSQLTDLRTCLPTYRLGPEHPFPAALEDAVAAYEYLLSRGYPADQITLGGDSAGGGLALSLLAHICQSDLPNPARVFVFSPWTDLTLSGESIARFEKIEALLPMSRMEETRAMYLNDADPTDPRASPLFAKYPDCPPVMLQVGSQEILRDDTLRMAAELEAQGCAVKLEVWDKTPHVWPILQGWLTEADDALQNIADFIKGDAAKSDLRLT